MGSEEKTTPFSSNATMRRGMAAAVPLRVWAKVVGLTGEEEVEGEVGVGVW